MNQDLRIVTLATLMLFITPAFANPRVSVTDLVTLHDIGGVSSGVSISPNGKYVVFEVHQATPDTNSYQNQWMLIDLQRHHSEVIIPDGGDPISPLGDRIGEYDDYHDLAVISPIWAPDSGAFYCIRKEGSQIGLHRVTLDGTDNTVPTPAGDVVDLHPEASETAVVVVRRMSQEAIAAADFARKSGILFTGDEFNPELGPPNPAAKKIDTNYRINLVTGVVGHEEIGSSALAELTSVVTPEYPDGVAVISQPVLSPDAHRIAWVGMVEPGRQPTSKIFFAVFVSDPTGKRVIRVSDRALEILLSLAWAPDSQHLYFLLPKGHIQSEVYLADISSGKSGPVTRASRWLDDCSFATSALIASCTIESLVDPPEVASIDLQTGGVDVLTDLNPQYRQLEKPRVEPLTWQNKYGHEAFGVLTYPYDYHEGVQYPLIVTVYHHPGFQRGSNGDEFPIAAFASNGFFVLDFTATTAAGYTMWADERQGDRAFHVWYRAWESSLSALQQEIVSLRDRGLVDSSRVGICGLSYGSNFAAFAISHSRIFRAAIGATMELDPIGVDYLTPKSIRDTYQVIGLRSGDHNHWKQFSAALRADRIRTPLLINAADHEYLLNLQLYWELRDKHRPVEMWVFNDEYHAKYQPAHRLAIYNRNLDWFKFWLLREEDPDPAKIAQYKRWKDLRDLLPPREQNN